MGTSEVERKFPVVELKIGQELNISLQQHTGKVKFETVAMATVEKTSQFGTLVIFMMLLD